MYIERVFTTQIDTKDPSVLYSTDLKESLRSILTTMYSGRCFKRCFITEILEIVKHSPAVCEWNRTGGSVRIALTFRVRGIIYERFEVIPDAKIIQIMEDGKIVLRSKYAAIILMSNPKLQYFKVGQMVPVRVYETRYVPKRNSVSVQGIPFVPIRAQEDREFEVQITDDDQKTLEPFYKRLQEEKKSFDTLDKKTQTAIADLFNPGKQKPPTGYSAVDITEVRGYGRILRPDWTPLGDTTVWWKSETKEQIIKNSAQVLKGYLNGMTKALNTAIALAELYDLRSKEPWIDVYSKEKSA